jgi:hypothetical protein
MSRSTRECYCFGLELCHICDPVTPRNKHTVIQCTGCGVLTPIYEIANSNIGMPCKCGGNMNEILYDEIYPAKHYKNKECIKCQTLQNIIDSLLLQKEQCEH